ncbi:hypothetical protein DACRYDRAFT_15158 [Dacryopinax primogenitus]|uniref:Uncharacterized protein n=1 Tax=Dacryopinax primogenitus (strain DJM 731) TaxID=1858805 RepID=M5G3R4_DACPD|nr:uncharacterized protein DACRYDRAFT_15158 [Dacryopinax primogenitus]EJU03314.1 hypothetical protein DACRYDRAFT_15158 [Dacryopinax primogenitus]
MTAREVQPDDGGLDIGTDLSFPGRASPEQVTDGVAQGREEHIGGFGRYSYSTHFASCVPRGPAAATAVTLSMGSASSVDTVDRFALRQGSIAANAVNTPTSTSSVDDLSRYSYSTQDSDVLCPREDEIALCLQHSPTVVTAVNPLGSAEPAYLRTSLYTSTTVSTSGNTAAAVPEGAVTAHVSTSCPTRATSRQLESVNGNVVTCSSTSPPPSYCDLPPASLNITPTSNATFRLTTSPSLQSLACNENTTEDVLPIYIRYEDVPPIYGTLQIPNEYTHLAPLPSSPSSSATSLPPSPTPSPLPSTAPTRT